MPPKVPGELTFLVSTSPSDARSVANKKRVRSVAALKSWPGRRKRAFEQLEHAACLSPDGVAAFVVDTPRSVAEKGYTKKRLSPRHDRERRPGGEVSQSTSSTASSPAGLSPPLTPDTFGHVSPLADGLQVPCPCRECQQPHEQSSELGLEAEGDLSPVLINAIASTSKTGTDIVHWLPTPSATPSPPVSKMADPFNCYPVPYKPWFDGILHHMLTVFAPRGWPTLNISREQGLRWEWYITQHALTEPALFYVRLLFASGDLIRLGALNPEVALWLQAQAIQAINEALADSKRATSDALILAVGRIAFHESIYGDRRASTAVHRPAQQRMIQLRGGMKALDFPELIKRLMRMIDKFMSIQGDTPRFIEDDDEGEDYSMRQTVEAMEEWAPNEGTILRRKIRISDLVND